MSEPILSPVSSGLGDHWATVNYCLRMSVAHRRPVLLTNQPAEWHRECHREGRLEEIVGLLDSRGGVRIVADLPTQWVPGEEIWRLPYHPTKVRWAPNRSNIFCYHTEPYTVRNEATPTAQEEQELIAGLEKLGLRPVKLTGSTPLDACVRLLASCEGFCGVSSGFAHMAHSVGTPLFLMQFRMDHQYLIKHHVGKPYTLCYGYQDFIEKLEWDLCVSNAALATSLTA